MSVTRTSIVSPVTPSDHGQRKITVDMYTNQGVVFKKSTGIYNLNSEDGKTVVCTISNRLRKRLIYPERDESSLTWFRVVDVEDIQMVDPVAIGDQVIFTDAGDGTGVITEILPRKSQLTRRAMGSKALEQVIVANVDQIVTVIAAAQPKPKWNMLDRYLASAEASDIPATVVITKLDLVRGKKTEREIMDVADDYAAIGYTVLLTSAADGQGVGAVKQILAGKLSALIGMSGVGKSTLLNAIQPELGLKVGEINTNIDKGRHTTTHLEMFALDCGGSIVDTPGMKLFGLWNTESEDIPGLFREFAPYDGTCKFGASCTHAHEPGCAIKKAVEKGAISQRRYDSYIHLRDYIYAEEK
ncbi:MAG: ribosome small subunit-dependent GTPase A [Chitinophagaceae bacterium]|nr:ribosome small subunit-dependent GTPase A [Anaerolineae bacterium]